MSGTVEQGNRRSISQVRSPEARAECQRPRLSIDVDDGVVLKRVGTSPQEESDSPPNVPEDPFTAGPWPKPTEIIQELVNDPTFELDMQSTGWISVKKSIRDILGYEFFCTGLLGEAMWPVHTGKARIVNGTVDREFQQGNRKLAMLGDAVMRSVLLDVWLRREEPVAKLDRRITSALCNSNLRAIAKKKKIDRVIAKHILGGVPDGNHILATTVKALVGAAWFDSKKDRAVVRKVIDQLLGTTLNEEHRK